MQLFHHENNGRFLLLPLECGNCGIGINPVTPRATSATTGKSGRATHSTNRKQGIQMRILQNRFSLIRELEELGIN
jgi:hypothetical protein